MRYLNAIHFFTTQLISQITKKDLPEEVSPRGGSFDETVVERRKGVAGLVVIINVTQHWGDIISGIIALFKKKYKKNIVKRSYASVKKPTPAIRIILSLNQNEEFSISLKSGGVGGPSIEE